MEAHDLSPRGILDHIRLISHDGWQQFIESVLQEQPAEDLIAEFLHQSASDNELREFTVMFLTIADEWYGTHWSQDLVAARDHSPGLANTQEQHGSHFDLLPAELHAEVLNYLPYETIARVADTDLPLPAADYVAGSKQGKAKRDDYFKREMPGHHIQEVRQAAEALAHFLDSDGFREARDLSPDDLRDAFDAVKNAVPTAVDTFLDVISSKWLFSEMSQAMLTLATDVSVPTIVMLKLTQVEKIAPQVARRSVDIGWNAHLLLKNALETMTAPGFFGSKPHPEHQEVLEQLHELAQELFTVWRHPFAVLDTARRRAV